jgi:ubiquinone/menaquinone biosynthesis C-methylase UbiE
MDAKSLDVQKTGEAYERWQRPTHSPAHARRTAERNAAFLLPLLHAGMRVLDAGCGPGSITLGLAEAVSGRDGVRAGEAIGIDASANAIEAACALSSERGVTGVRFEVADLYALPFETASFDAAFCHAVLQHLADPVAALREIRRVLRPGGVIGVADADHDGFVMWPHDALLDRSFALLESLRERTNLGDPRVGKRLRDILHKAGFVRSTGSATAVHEGTVEATRIAGEWQARYLESPQLVDYAIALGLATSGELAGMAEAWRAWATHAGAFRATFWCLALAWTE